MPLKSASERGVSAVLVAASLLLLLGMAAVALDGGRGFNERRQAQAGVDFAALAALNAAKSCDASGCDIDEAVEAGANEAIDVVTSNLRLLDWGNCDDPNRPGEFTRPADVTECVSFTDNLDKVRVVLPDNPLDTTFGRAIGSTSFDVAAYAHAGQYLNISSRVIPFTLAGLGNTACLYSNQAPQTVPPCNGGSDGNFGYLDVALFGNDDDPSVITPSTCELGDNNTRVAVNVALGADHNIVEHEPGDPVVNDYDACPNRSEDVNELEVKTGTPTGGITDGLINGISGSINGEPLPTAPGRIECHAESESCTDVRGDSLDDTPLYHFISDEYTTDDPLSSTDGYDRVPACRTVSNHDQMETCLSSWKAEQDVSSSDEPLPPLFDDSITDHPRFAAVPVFENYPTSGASGSYLVDRFAPVYLETIYFACNANACDTVFTPGSTNGPGGNCPDPISPDTLRCGLDDTTPPNVDVEGLTAFQLRIDMFSEAISEFFPGVPGTRETALTE